MGNMRGSPDNLLKEPPKELRAYAGKKSGESKRKKKMMREILDYYLYLPMKNGKINPPKSLEEVKGSNVEVLSAMLIVQIKKALQGDTKAFNSVMNVMRDSVNINVEVEDSSSKVLMDTLSLLKGKKPTMIEYNKDDVVEEDE